VDATRVFDARPMAPPPSLSRLTSLGIVALALLALPSATGCAGATPAPVAAPVEAPPWPAALDHTSTPETHQRAVDDLFATLNMKQLMDVALDNAMKVQIEANPKIAPLEGVMRKFMAKYLSLEGIREPLSKLYMDRLSELELVQLAAFYRTPLGKRTLVELPKMLEEGSQIGMKRVQDHMQELKEMIQAELIRQAREKN
jgi:hypothetical protein